ncbi:ABC transporter permease [Nocardioides sp. B-3]|uniref:ABC transporter permease n=1 Tax=Nocardioides sp. B-3 TaxID=2895565 RepID=UPI00300E17FC
MSIIERTREVGLLRAIGVSRPQLRRMVTPGVGGDRGARCSPGRGAGHRVRDRAHALAARGGVGGDLGADGSARDLPRRLGRDRGWSLRCCRPGEPRSWTSCAQSVPNERTNLWTFLYHALRQNPHASL